MKTNTIYVANEASVLFYLTAENATEQALLDLLGSQNAKVTLDPRKDESHPSVVRIKVKTA